VGIAAFGLKLADVADAARAADRAGFDTVWTQELYNRSATVALAAIAQATSRCAVGTGIVYGVGRSPLMLAAEARDLDELSHGRLILGVGNGTRRMISDWHGQDGEAPARRMEELVPLIRAIWHLGERSVDHEGRFYRVRISSLGDIAQPPREIPIYTAGVNPRMIESAGRVADGLLGHTMYTPRYIQEVVRPALERGAAYAERDPSDVRFATYTLAVADADEDRARRDAAAMIAFYASVKSYGALFATTGFGRQAKAVQAAFAARDLPAMIGAVTDAMIDEFACAGTPAQVRDKLRRYDGMVDEVALSPPSFQISSARGAEILGALIAHCRPEALGPGGS
jgi:probable F420-dependent oxidoreductase